MEEVSTLRSEASTGVSQAKRRNVVVLGQGKGMCEPERRVGGRGVTSEVLSVAKPCWEAENEGVGGYQAGEVNGFR